jgi:hypothetical protein
MVYADFVVYVVVVRLSFLIQLVACMSLFSLLFILHVRIETAQQMYFEMKASFSWRINSD